MTTYPKKRKDIYPCFFGLTHSTPERLDFLELSAHCKAMLTLSDKGVNPFLSIPGRYRALILDLYPGGPPWEYAMPAHTRVDNFRRAVRQVEKRIKEHIDQLEQS